MACCRRRPERTGPPRTRSREASLLGYLAAALGGALGALARWGVARALPHSPGAWPWATLVVNVTGCFLIGVLLAVLLARLPGHPWLRPFLATGVLGGYTTYSTFAVDAVQLADAASWGAALGYLAASVLGGVLAVVAGLVVGRAVAGRPGLMAAPVDLAAGEGTS